MDAGIAIDLGRGGLEYPRPQALGETQHVDRAMDTGLGGLHRVVLVVDGARGASQVVDLVDFHIKRERHVVADDLEARIGNEMRDVPAAAGEEIVDADDFVALGQKPFAQERAEEPGTSRHQDSF
jgi:hypothetical protein